jgi:hypothetical protein
MNGELIGEFPDLDSAIEGGQSIQPGGDRYIPYKIVQEDAVVSSLGQYGATGIEPKK